VLSGPRIAKKCLGQSPPRWITLEPSKGIAVNPVPQVVLNRRHGKDSQHSFTPNVNKLTMGL
tara:strand:- start:8778 stop:8963 length:186 start_codon:yes stop_codon:yes gene_type:complete